MTDHAGALADLATAAIELGGLVKGWREGGDHEAPAWLFDAIDAMSSEDAKRLLYAAVILAANTMGATGGRG